MNADANRTRLTDGGFAPEGSAVSLWGHGETVGWRDNNPIITIDLGERQPIGGVSFHTAGSDKAEVYWPTSIVVMVSDDAKSWTMVGDLVEMSNAVAPPPDARNETVNHTFVAEFEAVGRYVALQVICAPPYVFCDEVEVYRGDEAFLSRPMKGETVDGVSAIHHFGARSAIRLGVAKRLNLDLAAVRESLAAAAIPAAERKLLEGRLDRAEQEVSGIPGPENPRAFQTILPLNDVHAEILAVHGAILRAKGLPRIVLGKPHRFELLRWLNAPVKAADPSLAVEMMGNEFRADAFVISNTGDKTGTASIRLLGFPDLPSPPWLSVSSVPWTDTQQGVPVAQALSAAKLEGGAFQIPLPSGMSRMVWLTVDSSKLPAGTYKGTVQIDAMGQRLSIPLMVRVSPLSMGRPRLSLGMWDYSDAQSRLYGVSPENVHAAVELMRSHFVDSPWASAAVFLRPGQTGKSGGDVSEFGVLDAWIARWPDARNYLVFAGVSDSFDGAAAGTKPFEDAVGNWAVRLVQHMRELKIKPEQLCIMLVDEPHNDEMFGRVVAWGRVIKAAAPELTIFEIPNWTPERSAIHDEMIALTDIACMGTFSGPDDPARKYYEPLREKGQRRWFYQCSGPTRHFDPDYYYRRFAWRAFRYDASGIGIWSFGDTGGAPSSWNEYVQPRASFAPEFLGVDDATDSVQMQAIREGIEDYEYLAMLRDAARATSDEKLRGKAEALLAEAAAAVGTGVGIPEKDRNIPADHAAADKYRLRVLALLEELSR